MRGDHEQARSLHKESLELSRELGDKLLAAESLEGLACSASTSGEEERAARLFGAAEALREAEGYFQAPRERALREPFLGVARSQLWQEALAQGRAMSLEEAVEYALSEGNYTALHAHAEQDSPANESPPALTRREREVASLVAQDITNRQIASELFISERTVDHHVEKILKKLELFSREQVASRLAI